MYQTIVEAVLAHGEQTPDKPAVCFKRQRVTYGELARNVRAFAGLLREREQVGPGDVVMVSALSKPEYVTALLGIQYLGATAVPVDKSMLEQSMTRLYHQVEPKLILTDSRMSDGAAEKRSLREWYAAAESRGGDCPAYELPAPESIAEIIFTTGTTGDPKGAMLSYGAILSGTLNTRDGVHRNESNVELLPLPLNHSFGLRVLRTLLYVGATVVLQNGFMLARDMEDNLREYDCTGIAIVPASVERLYQNLGDRFPDVFGRFSYIEVSAGSLSVGMKQKLLAILPQVRLYNVWGSSETGGVIFLDVTGHPEHIASLGIPAPDVEVAALDADGRRIEADSPENAGRMIMKGTMQMSGYYKRPDVTAQTIVDGWLYTGDLIYKTPDGFVYMLGRADDIINVGGEKVSPIEVEDTASLYEGFRECACVGGADPDGVYGQVPVLFVVPADASFDEEAARRFLSQKMEQYKLPKRYVVVDEIPRNAMKKIDRKKLKQMLQSGGAAVERNPVISAIYTRRSVRDFQKRPVPRELLEQVVACGYQAPSGHNMQSWRFTVITDHAEIMGLKALIGPVAKRNKVYFYGYNEPAALILISNDRRDPYGIQDSSCAAQNIMLAAHSLGLGSVWINVLMKLCDEPEIRPVLDGYGIPASHNVWATIALGYPANTPSPLAKMTNVVRWITGGDENGS